MSLCDWLREAARSGYAPYLWSLDRLTMELAMIRLLLAEYSQQGFLAPAWLREHEQRCQRALHANHGEHVSPQSPEDH